MSLRANKQLRLGVRVDVKVVWERLVQGARAVKSCTHSYGSATLRDVYNVLSQNPFRRFKAVIVIADFSDCKFFSKCQLMTGTDSFI